MSSQPVPKGVMAGQRDMDEIGGIGEVKQTSVEVRHGSALRTRTKEMLLLQRCFTNPVLYFVAFNLRCTTSSWQELQTRKHKSL